MSLWTPDGEHPVDRQAAPSPGEHGSEDAELGEYDDPFEGLTPEEKERAMQMAQEMDEVRQQLASVPAAVVVANHAMGLYELAAIHLSAQPPNFVEAQLAIDALGAIVERLQGRLGDNEATLQDAYRQLQMAYVQLHAAAANPDGG
jgi:uncharacterized protein with GYD domain